MLHRVVGTFGLLAFLVTLPVAAQLKEIDSAKLPQSPAVQAAFRSAQELELYANTWSPNWRYNIPQAQVQDKLSDDLGILSKALQADPANHELLLLTGLVAHFAYNVNNEAAFDIAVADLTKAANADPSDVRGNWFLGIHQCQSLQVVSGMNRLLEIEARDKNLPSDFWNDYITCANISILPAHTLRAIDHAVAGGESPEAFRVLSQLAVSRYKAADLAKTISAHDAWMAEKTDGGRMAFSSHLCGASFSIEGNWQLQINDIANGVCSASFSPPQKKKEAVPTFLLMAKSPATESQSLDDFAKSFLKGRSAQLSPLQSLCPATSCLAFDVRLPDMYPDQGGGHILLVAFESEQPRYDGLLLEKPQGPPLQGTQPGPVAFRAEPNFRRIPGRLFYLVVLDSNEKIFASSKPMFDAFLQSLIVE